MTPPVAWISVAGRVAVLAAGVAILGSIPWDTPVRAGRMGCLVVAVRTWFVGIALVLAALQWFPAGGNSRKTARGL